MRSTGSQNPARPLSQCTGTFGRIAHDFPATRALAHTRPEDVSILHEIFAQPSRFVPRVSVVVAMPLRIFDRNEVIFDSPGILPSGVRRLLT
jgi:hypothetical protein